MLGTPLKKIMDLQNLSEKAVLAKSYGTWNYLIGHSKLEYERLFEKGHQGV